MVELAPARQSGYTDAMKRLRRFLRTTLRWVLRATLALVAAIALYLLVALVLTLIPVNRDFVEDPNGIEILVIGDGVHTDFCVPRKNAIFDWDTVIPKFRDDSYAGELISFGWGDRGFYLEVKEWGDLSVGRAFESVFLPTPVAMHVDRDPYLTTDTRSLKLSPDQYRRLVAHIRDSFQLDPQGKVLQIDHPGYYSEDRFFEAKGSYHLFYTCNSWTNDGLKQAGVKTALWAPFPASVRYHLPPARN